MWYSVHRASLLSNLAIFEFTFFFYRGVLETKKFAATVYASVFSFCVQVAHFFFFFLQKDNPAFI